MITRKLHFSYLPKSARIRVQVCELRDVQRTSKLLSSTDGPIAIEVHRPADKEQRRAWVAIGEHHFQCVAIMPWDAAEASAIAIQVWSALGRPDVGALVFNRDLALVWKCGVTGGWGWMAPRDPLMSAEQAEQLAEAPVELN